MSATRARLGLRISGVVQGVGFRPFVHRLAGELGLVGHVGNDAAGVFVEVEGPSAAVASFTVRVERDAPPLARVDEVRTTWLAPAGEAGDATAFTIVASPSGGPVATLVPPDVGICAACRAELFDPADRRLAQLHAVRVMRACAGPRCGKSAAGSGDVSDAVHRLETQNAPRALPGGRS